MRAALTLVLALVACGAGGRSPRRPKSSGSSCRRRGLPKAEESG